MTANAIDAHELARSLNQLMAGGRFSPAVGVLRNFLAFPFGLQYSFILFVLHPGRISFCQSKLLRALGLGAVELVGTPFTVLVLPS